MNTQIALEHRKKDPSFKKSQDMLDIMEDTKSFTFIRSCNFYKLFWIFLTGCVFGCYMEQIRCYCLTGIWESRAGVIWGPFSQVYGFGAIMMFIIYQKLMGKSSLTIFVTAMFFGAAFEYAAGLFLELVFDSALWDYSNEVMNIGGKTSLKYAVYWGILGFIFTKWIFPLLDCWYKKIKGKFAFIITWILIIFMAVNLICSSLAINRWNNRLQGTKPLGSVDKLLDKYYGNEKMEKLFPNMHFMVNYINGN